MTKSYLSAKDVMAIIGVSKSKAYRILRTLRSKSIDGQQPWGETYEAEYIGKTVIPTSIFLKEFPHARASVRTMDQ